MNMNKTKLLYKTKDLIKNTDKKITEISNEVKALKEDISNGLLVRTKTFDDDSFVKNEDPVKLRNGVLNVYNKGIQQVQERSKQLGNKKYVESEMPSSNNLKIQREEMNEKRKSDGK